MSGVTRLVLMIIMASTHVFGLEDDDDTICSQIKSGTKKLLAVGELTGGTHYFIGFTDGTGLKVPNQIMGDLTHGRPYLKLTEATFINISSLTSTRNDGKSALLVHANTHITEWKGVDHIAVLSADHDRLVGVPLDGNGTTAKSKQLAKTVNKNFNVFFSNASANRKDGGEFLVLHEDKLLESKWITHAEDGSLDIEAKASQKVWKKTPVDGGWVATGHESHKAVFFGFDNTNATVYYAEEGNDSMMAVKYGQFFRCKNSVDSTDSPWWKITIQVTLVLALVLMVIAVYCCCFIRPSNKVTKSLSLRELKESSKSGVDGSGKSTTKSTTGAPDASETAAAGEGGERSATSAANKSTTAVQ